MVSLIESIYPLAMSRPLPPVPSNPQSRPLPPTPRSHQQVTLAQSSKRKNIVLACQAFFPTAPFASSAGGPLLSSSPVTSFPLTAARNACRTPSNRVPVHRSLEDVSVHYEVAPGQRSIVPDAFRPSRQIPPAREHVRHRPIHQEQVHTSADDYEDIDENPPRAAHVPRPKPKGMYPVSACVSIR